MNRTNFHSNMVAYDKELSNIDLNLTNITYLLHKLYINVFTSLNISILNILLYMI